MNDDYTQTSVTTWRLRELLQMEKDNVQLRRRILQLEEGLKTLQALLEERRRVEEI